MYKDILEGIRINSIEGFINTIRDLGNSISDTPDNLWFRAENEAYGHSQLIPSFYRDFSRKQEDWFLELDQEACNNLNLIEGNLKSKFKTSSSTYHSMNNFLDNDWEMYFLMQHYGISTRLLDWTKSALIALYFCVEKEPQTDGTIWLLNPYELNRYSDLYEGIQAQTHQYIYTPQTAEKELQNVNNELTKYLNLDLDKKSPIAIMPTWFDARMKSQKSCFTIFGSHINGLLANKNCNKFLQKIVIEKYSMTIIKNELAWLGITNESIYPGLDGIGKDIMSETKRILCI
ncbi:FRG domain-containing protein [Faecalibacter rhinopitheci]|uniref:FRG domain-containing protein n=1 Tax=Faecalibacter rhinopitheci TaxID=2779678 RepID=A0A8J7FNM9_9FLAO|nr:FRG domain-containing protein [Faecalibacter rhinopitheci]MBF0596394.1 FRG domain-containing protein [Faecalibacter rhinopitheci]